jgi:glycosyltransferase involved in cell wall biosynthesis
VNDGSTDDTARRLADMEDARLRIITQPNAGVSAARNRGLAEVDTPYVMFLDGDDVLHPDALLRLRQGLLRADEAVVAFGSLRKILANSEPYPGERSLDVAAYPTGDVLAAMVRENFLANGGHALIRTSAARRAGGFDTTLRLSEDWEFWCRLAVLGPFEYIGAKPEVFYLRVTVGSSSGGLAADWNNHLPALNAVLNNPDIVGRFGPSAWRKLARKVRASHRWEAGRVNFTCRQFATARRLMLRSLVEDFRLKRFVLFALAQVSEATGRSLVSRLRFRSDDDVPTAASGS